MEVEEETAQVQGQGHSSSILHFLSHHHPPPHSASVDAGKWAPPHPLLYFGPWCGKVPAGKMAGKLLVSSSIISVLPSLPPPCLCLPLFLPFSFPFFPSFFIFKLTVSHFFSNERLYCFRDTIVLHISDRMSVTQGLFVDSEMWDTSYSTKAL